MKKKRSQLSENTIALRWQNKAYRVYFDLNGSLYTDSLELANSFNKEVVVVGFNWEENRPL